jgi:hypothetical protein
MNPLSSLFSVGSTIIDHFFPNPNDAAKNKIELMTLLNSEKVQSTKAYSDLMSAQISVDKTEAASSNLFVAGWRPFIGWVCGAAFAWQYVALPIIETITRSMGIVLVLPAFDYSTLYQLLTALLGIGGMRTYEKLKHVNHLHG